MKLLLTSGGITNATIQETLVELLGKPIAESNALCIPTAQYGHPNVGMGERPWTFISGNEDRPMTTLGWKSIGLLELTALPSIDEERWVPVLREADALLVAGGDVVYLAHWIRESGLFDLFPSLADTVWVGLSAGSMVMAPRVGYDFVQWEPPSGRTDTTLGLVDFAICPHLVPDRGRGNTMAECEEWAATVSGEKYIVDDETAIVVADGEVRVVSEGTWKHLPG